MKKKLCKRCNIMLHISKFTRAHNRNDKSIEYIRDVCHKCQYGWNTFWKDASEDEKLERMRQLFEKRVIRKDGCWDFIGQTSTAGYFRIRIGGKQKLRKSEMAHRISWIIHNGNIPDNMCVCHKCDNRRCTNPEHLFLGTHHDNVLDREKKGRGNQRKEEDHNKAVLTRVDVRKIKQLLKSGVMATKIARDFGVGSSTIYNIKYGNTWKHVK